MWLMMKGHRKARALGATRLVSTRVPTDLARAVELAAARELISVASFARRALLQAVRAKVVDHG